MLSARELNHLQTLTENYSYPQIDSELLRELLDTYREHHHIPKPEQPPQPKRRLIAEGDQPLDN